MSFNFFFKNNKKKYSDRFIYLIRYFGPTHRQQHSNLKLHQVGFFLGFHSLNNNNNNPRHPFQPLNFFLMSSSTKGYTPPPFFSTAYSRIPKCLFPNTSTCPHVYKIKNYNIYIYIYFLFVSPNIPVVDNLYLLILDVKRSFLPSSPALSVRS